MNKIYYKKLLKSSFQNYTVIKKHTPIHASVITNERIQKISFKQDYISHTLNIDLAKFTIAVFRSPRFYTFFEFFQRHRVLQLFGQHCVPQNRTETTQRVLPIVDCIHIWPEKFIISNG